MAVAVAGWKCPTQTFKGTVINVTYHHFPGVVYWREARQWTEEKIDNQTGEVAAGVGKPTGWGVEMYDMIAEKLGFEFSIRPARSKAIANVSSSICTSITYDIGQGINDIAIGVFYETPERLSYSDVRVCAHFCMCAWIYAVYCACCNGHLSSVKSSS